MTRNHRTLTALTIAAFLTAPTLAHAESYNPDDYPQPTEDGCTLYWFQGAPAKQCPRQEPDPTNCYTGDYQGVPIEICKPTGYELPAGTIDTATGEPPVIHNQTGYVPPVETPEPVTTPAPAPVDSAPVVNVRAWPEAFDGLQSALVANGGW